MDETVQTGIREVDEMDDLQDLLRTLYGARGGLKAFMRN
jgi:hypothetical protein